MITLIKPENSEPILDSLIKAARALQLVNRYPWISELRDKCPDVNDTIFYGTLNALDGKGAEAWQVKETMERDMLMHQRYIAIEKKEHERGEYE